MANTLVRSRRRFGLPIVVAAALFALSSAAAAADDAATVIPVFHVNDPADVDDADLRDGRCRTSGGTCTLRAAVRQATTFAQARILLPAGTFPLDNPDFVEGLELTRGVRIRGASARTTAIEGGVRGFLVHPGAQAAISDLAIRGMNVDGSGAAVRNNGELVISRVHIVGNSAFGDGGGIENAGVLRVESSTIARNRAGNSGAGITNRGTLTALNSTLSSNIVGEDGAGIGGGLRNSGVARVLLTNVTVAFNAAPNGSGLADDAGGSAVRVLNTVVGPRGSGGGPNCTGTIAGLGGNWSTDGSCALRVGGDPRLGPLQDSGGPTDTHRPMANSGLIDGGVNQRCPARDQRGVSRPQDGNGDGVAFCDVGAVERVSPQ